MNKNFDLNSLILFTDNFIIRDFDAEDSKQIEKLCKNNNKKEIFDFINLKNSDIQENIKNSIVDDNMFVIECDDEIIGYLKINKIALEIEESLNITIYLKYSYRNIIFIKEIINKLSWFLSKIADISNYSVNCLISDETIDNDVFYVREYKNQEMNNYLIN